MAVEMRPVVFVFGGMLQDECRISVSATPTELPPEEVDEFQDCEDVEPLSMSAGPLPAPLPAGFDDPEAFWDCDDDDGSVSGLP